MAKYILFLCTENSARSQMAEAFFNHLDRNPGYIAISAGTSPAPVIKKEAIAVMKEKGIDIAGQRPKLLTSKMAEKSARIYTMGCIRSCPVTPKEKTTDWQIEDPKGKSLDVYRSIRDDIEERIKRLISELDENQNIHLNNLQHIYK